MSSTEGEQTPATQNHRQARLLSWLLGVVPLLLLLALGVTAFQFRDEYNPFWDRTREFRAVQTLAVTLHKRSLTEDEFRQALVLCEVGHVQARADAVSVVEESVKREPGRGATAVPVLERLVRSRYSKPREAAQRVLKLIEDQRGPE